MKELSEKEKRVIGSLLSMWRVQQRERDRIMGFKFRVFLALIALVVVLSMLVCLAAVCCACFAVPAPQRSHLHVLGGGAGQHDSDGEEEHYSAENNMWHRP